MRNREAGPPGLVRRMAAIACAAWLVAAGVGTPALAQQKPDADPAQGKQDANPAQQASQTGEKRGNDYPTLARVEFVFECLSDNPGPRHEMVYKCVCAIDRVAEEVPYDRWVDLSTFFKAQPMAGERGAYVRERSDIRAQLKSYRELQLKAKKACFIPTDRD